MFSVSASDNPRGHHGQITLEAAGVAAEVDINVTEDETFICAPITANPIFNILLLGQRLQNKNLNTLCTRSLLQPSLLWGHVLIVSGDFTVSLHPGV